MVRRIPAYIAGFMSVASFFLYSAPASGDPADSVAVDGFERALSDSALTASRTVFSGEDIQRLPVNSLEEIIMASPASFGGSLRNSGTPTRTLFIDGAAVPLSAFDINPYMIERLEVRAGVYDAAYRDVYDGITTLTTRGGGQRFHGNLSFRTLAQKGLNWTRPPDLDLVDAFRAKEFGAEDLRALINGLIRATDNFNSDPARDIDGLKLRYPFDVLDTTAVSPALWTARYSRDNFYWDYDRIIPEADAAGWSYLTEGRIAARQYSRTTDRAFTPGKYNRFMAHNRTEKRPVQVDWGVGGPIGRRMDWFASGRFSESFGRTPNAYSRLINGFAKFTVRPTGTMKLSASALIEDRGAYTGKGQRPELTGDNYYWKYIAEGLNERYDGGQLYTVRFDHTLGPRTAYSVRLSHLRRRNESLHPKYPEGSIPSPYPPPGIFNRPIEYERLVDKIGYIPREYYGRPAVGYHTYGDQVYSASANDFLRQPNTTDLSVSINRRLTAHHDLHGGWNAIIESDTAVFHYPGSLSKYGLKSTEYGIYAGDRITYGGLTANLEGRLNIVNEEYTGGFLPRPSAPGDIRAKRNSDYTHFSPRLHIGYRITRKVYFYMGYGQYRQYFHVEGLFNILESSGVMEFGAQYEGIPGWHLSATFYDRSAEREIRDLPSNIQIEGIYPLTVEAKTLEVSVTRQAGRHITAALHYTATFSEDVQITTAGLPPGESELVNAKPVRNPVLHAAPSSIFPLYREHQMIASVTLDLPLDTYVTLLTRAENGISYITKNQSTTDPLQLLGSVRRTPWVTTTDLLARKTFRLTRTTHVGVFCDIRNVFDRTNIYAIGASPASDRYARRGDPVRFTGGPISGIGYLPGTPRDVYVGVNFGW